MHKYSRFIIYIFIGLIAFTVGALIAQQVTISKFQEDVVIPSTKLALTSTSTSYQRFNQQYIIGTSTTQTADNQVDLANDIDYLNLSIYSKNNAVEVYGGNDLSTIKGNDPLLTCTPSSKCTFENSVKYNYYLISSEGRVDSRIITGQENQDN